MATVSSRRAFTLIELLVVIGIIGVLVTLVVPVLRRAKELANRATCASNLHTVGRGMHMYASGYDSLFPDLFKDRRDAGKLGNITVDHRGNSCNMYALVLGGQAPAGAFVCPSTRHTTTRTNVSSQFDFVSYQNLSYSMHRQRKTKDAAPSDAQPLTLISDGKMALAADRTPIAGETSWDPKDGGYVCRMEDDSQEGGYDEKSKNSFNHDQEGQNVLQVVGTVVWAETPRAGIGDDNIWTVNDGTADGATSNAAEARLRNCAPANDTDSLLMP